MKRVHGVAAALVVLLGMVHVGMTPVFFDELTMRVMWYIAQGLLGIAVGVLNIALARAAWRDRVSTVLCHTVNGLSLAFGIIYSTVDPALPSYVGIALFALLFVSALALDRRQTAA